MTAAQQANAERLAKLAADRAIANRVSREKAALTRIEAVTNRLTEDERNQLSYITEQLAQNSHEYEGREQLLVERRNDLLSRVERRIARRTEHPVPTEVAAIADQWAAEDHGQLAPAATVHGFDADGVLHVTVNAFDAGAMGA